jgi:hypothetical protein
MAHAPSEGPEFGRPFDLRPAETVTIAGLRITFEGVNEDSRCPTGVQCAWAGDAAAGFTLEKPPAAAVQRTLHTHGRYERQTALDGFVVHLEDIKPYPKEGATIAPGDYRATLVVTRPSANVGAAIAFFGTVNGISAINSQLLQPTRIYVGALFGDAMHWRRRRAGSPADDAAD